MYNIYLWNLPQFGKFSSRIKFLWKKLQRDEFVRLFEEEYKYPGVAPILKKCRFKVAFFQGEFDNQTPAYQLRGVEHAQLLHRPEGGRVGGPRHPAVQPLPRHGARRVRGRRPPARRDHAARVGGDARAERRRALLGDDQGALLHAARPVDGPVHGRRRPGLRNMVGAA